MRIRSISLKGYKRFKDLTIDLGDEPARIVALVGPNGCGKSSVLDALLFLQAAYAGIGGTGQRDYRYHSLDQDPDFDMDKVTVGFSDGSFPEVWGRRGQERNTLFSFRSSYRYNTEVKIDEIRSVEDIGRNEDGASTAIAMDSKMEINYRRLQAKYSRYRDHNDVRPSEARRHVVDELNRSLKACLDVEIKDLGVVEDGRGTLYFARGDQEKWFAFDLLSSGEKEVVDLLLDLYLRQDTYNDTVFLIDEPELHLNTSIQRKLLHEIDRLVGKDCQIWVATHSIGFLRALQDDVRAECQVIDLGKARDLGSKPCTLGPMPQTRANWKSVFETALDDLAGLICPQRLVYCEGKAKSRTGEDKGLDANVYNTVFGQTHSDTLFVSSGGNTEPAHASELGISILSKVFNDVDILVLVDRDFGSGKTTSQIDRQMYLANNPPNHRVLERWEIENYLYDREVLRKYCEEHGLEFDEQRYVRAVRDIVNDNVKDRTGDIKRACGITASISPYHFKLQLASCITPDTAVYREIEACIFCGV